MPVRPMPPEPDAPLCEQCGYRLDGLAQDARCPECGQWRAASLENNPRRPALVEQQGFSLLSWWRTAWRIWCHPGLFFRQLSIRTSSPEAFRFALVNHGIAAMGLGLTAHGHWQWLLTHVPGIAAGTAAWNAQDQVWQRWLLVCLLAFCALLLQLLLYHGIARLTTWEAGYRGVRLPLPVAQRVLRFHGATLIPCALSGVVVTHLLARPPSWWPSALVLAGHWYLWTLSALVVLCAAYLFLTYWMAMRSVFYANR